MIPGSDTKPTQVNHSVRILFGESAEYDQFSITQEKKTSTENVTSSGLYYCYPNLMYHDM